MNLARVADDKDVTRFYNSSELSATKTPPMNASIGRFGKVFLETHEGLTDDLQQMNEALADWLTWYNGFRPSPLSQYDHPA